MTPSVHSFSLSRPLPGESVSACWCRLVDFSRWPAWNSSLREVSQSSPGNPGRGGVLAMETASGGRFEWRIAHWEPQVRVAFTSRDKFARYAWCFELPVDSAPGERRLKLSLELQCNPGARPLFWWLRWGLRRKANRFLDRFCGG